MMTYEAMPCARDGGAGAVGAAARRAVVERALVTHRAAHLGWLRRRLDNPADVEDLYQDFCLRALAKAGQLRDDGAVHGWLKRLLFSILQDHYRLRHATRRGLDALAAAEAIAGQGSTETDAPAHEPQLCACVHEQLLRLRPDHQELLRELDFHGRSREEMAASLGLSSGTLRVRLHRARRALKETLRTACPRCLEGAEGCHFADSPCNA
ncbi:MAG: RNA polymerase sigma factor [Alphaproteobacteria bacterium]|nr:MAG: RNA polymerase sigma factor [Alphaproteobacteria bacterium]